MDLSTHSTLPSGSRHRVDDLNNLHTLIEAAQINPEAERRLKSRKKWEFKLIQRFEKTKIKPPSECWFLMDTKWLNEWHQFVKGALDEEPPGPVSTKDLLDENGKPLPKLKVKIDYRGVSPMAYAVFVELYGKDRSPELCRFEVDIYKQEVPIDRQVNIKKPCVVKAKVEVNKLRPKWMNWEVEFEDDEVEPDCWCCGLTKEHFEAFLYWMIHCWARRKSGRADIQYSAYSPLRGVPDDSMHSNLGNSSTHSVGSLTSNQSAGSAHGRSPVIASTSSTPNNSSHGVRSVSPPEESDNSSSSWSDEEGGLQMAPADKGYERGNWLSGLLGGGSSHGGGLPGGSSHGSNQGSTHDGSSHGNVSNNVTNTNVSSNVTNNSN